jgi:hypothetical protein
MFLQPSLSVIVMVMEVLHGPQSPINEETAIVNLLIITNNSKYFINPSLFVLLAQNPSNIRV